MRTFWWMSCLNFMFSRHASCLFFYNCYFKSFAGTLLPTTLPRSHWGPWVRREFHREYQCNVYLDRISFQVSIMSRYNLHTAVNATENVFRFNYWKYWGTHFSTPCMLTHSLERFDVTSCIERLLTGFLISYLPWQGYFSQFPTLHIAFLPLWPCWYNLTLTSNVCFWSCVTGIEIDHE